MPDCQKRKLCYFVPLRMVPPSLCSFYLPQIISPESQVTPPGFLFLSLFIASPVSFDAALKLTVQRTWLRNPA